MLSRYFLDFSVGVGAFVTGLSQISSFFFYCQSKLMATKEKVITLLVAELKHIGIPSLYQVMNGFGCAHAGHSNVALVLLTFGMIWTIDMKSFHFGLPKRKHDTSNTVINCSSIKHQGNNKIIPQVLYYWGSTKKKQLHDEIWTFDQHNRISLQSCLTLTMLCYPEWIKYDREPW